MQFETPQAIWFFWIIPVLLVAFFFCERRRLRLLNHFIMPEFLRERLPDYAGWKTWLQLAFFLLGIACLGVALLRPYAGFEMKELSRQGIDLFFLVDVSPSMLAQDVKPNRVERAKFEIRDFLSALTGDRVGLIAFSGESFVLVPLTGDYRAFAMFLAELSPELIPVPGTDIPGAVAKAVETFKKQSSGSAKAIILITDGEDSVGLAEGVIGNIKEGGIKTFVIGIGTPDGAPIPLSNGGYKTDAQGGVVLTRLNEAALQELAVATGGGYVRSVSGDMDLQQIYNEGIRKTFEAGEFQKTQKKLPHYRFQAALAAGLLFLALETLTSKKRRRWLGRWRLRRRSLKEEATA